MNQSLVAASIIGSLFFIAPAASAQTGTACTMQYQPVCGAQQVQCVTTPCYPIYKTYGNACVLSAEGGTYIHDGECRAEETGPVMPRPAYTPPADCTAWFDGCNQCGRGSGGQVYCTERACVDAPAPGYCTSYATPTTVDDSPEEPVSTDKPDETVADVPVPEERNFFTSLWDSIRSLVSSWF